MKKLLLFFCGLFFQQALCQWENLDTGIDDDLTGIAVFQNTAAVTAHSGIYYSTNAMEDWTHFEITGNAEDAAIYDNTEFYHCFSTFATDDNARIFACGTDTSADKAIIFELNLQSLDYNIIYIGETGSRLNKIAADWSGYYAVGDDGLLVHFSEIEEAVEVTIDTEADLRSIVFTATTPYIITENNVFSGYISNDSFFITDEFEVTGGRDMVPYSFNDAYFITDSAYVYKDNSGNLEGTSNFYSPLNPVDIIEYMGVHYVATDHGIFMSDDSYTYLEHQLSSGTGSFTGFTIGLGSGLYACGEEGAIMFNAEGGGATQPYVRLDNVIRCVDEFSNFSIFSGSSNNCVWTLDGEAFYTGCNNFGHTFTEPGTHELVVESTNAAGITTTITEIFNVAPVPENDKPLIMDIGLLCKAEPVSITIEDTQEDVLYILMKEGEENGGYGYVEGNGGTVTLNSSPVDIEGDYYIRAKSALADCHNDFTETFYIEVEETEATNHVGLINAKVGEEVLFYENATDADNWEWTFNGSATPGSTNTMDTVVTYSQTGPTDGSLHVWSDTGCEDTNTFTGPYVYEEGDAGAGNWVLIQDGHSLVGDEWESFYNENTAFKYLPDGFLTAAHYNGHILDSRAGVKLDLEGKAGSYLARYDHDGVLKWIVRTELAVSEASSTIFDIAVDSQGNIYLVLKGRGDFYDNSGNRQSLFALGANAEPIYTNPHYIIKLDRNGKFIWKQYTTHIFPTGVEVDNVGNVVVCGTINQLSYYDQYFNDENLGPMTDITDPETGNFIAKYSSDGAFLWDAGLMITGPNAKYLSDMTVDDANNIYLNGGYETGLKIYDADETAFIEGNGGGSFIVKYLPEGDAQWFFDCQGTQGASGFSAITNGDGSHFVFGNNEFETFPEDGNVNQFNNADGTITPNPYSRHFIARFNNNGICEWVAGSTGFELGGIHVKSKTDTELIFAGFAGDYDTILGNGTFHDTDGTAFEAEMEIGEMFIATYDLEGKLKRVSKSGPNGETPLFGVVGLHKAEDEYFYVSRNVYFFLDSPDQQFYGHMIPYSATQGTISHFKEEDGQVIYTAPLATGEVDGVVMALAPNPTSKSFTIKLGATYPETRLLITDVTGKRVLEKQYNNLNEITADITGQAGMYFVEVDTGSNKQWFKVLKN